MDINMQAASLRTLKVLTRTSTWETAIMTHATRSNSLNLTSEQRHGIMYSLSSYRPHDDVFILKQ